MKSKHADLLSPDAMRDYFGEVYWRKGEGLDREKILDAFRRARASWISPIARSARNFA